MKKNSVSSYTYQDSISDRKRLHADMSTKTNLIGIVTYLKLDNGLYLGLSRFEHNSWFLPDHWFSNDKKSSQRKLDFTLIKIPTLRVAAKIVMCKIIWCENSIGDKRRGVTIFSYFTYIRCFLNWLPTINITKASAVTPLVAMQYIEHIKSLKSDRGKYKGKPLSSMSIFKRLQAVERCHIELRDTLHEFSHPWPESSAISLSGHRTQGKPKTDIIPDHVLAPLFQHAESALASAPDLLRLQSLLKGFNPNSKNRESQSLQRTAFLRSKGWDSGGNEYIQAIKELRDCCILIILLTTGIRAHELCNIKRDKWYSEVRDGERFYFISSKSEKTGEGETHWLCPEITIDAIKILQELTLPMQSRLVQQIKDAQNSDDYKEVLRLNRISGSVLLTTTNKHNNKIHVISSGAINVALQKLSDKLGMNLRITSHMFRRTLAVYVVHHKLGDLRYLRDHFKHWSIDMTVLYGMNDKQDLELYDQIYAAFDDERQGIIGHWLEQDTPLSGGLANQIRNLRDKNQPTRTYKSRKIMIEQLSELIYLRSTGLAWCTNDDGSCAGGHCDECEHGLIDDKKQAFWEGVYMQQIELKQVNDLGDSGQVTVDKAIIRCERVLSDLGVDINAIKQKNDPNA